MRASTYVWWIASLKAESTTRFSNTPPIYEITAVLAKSGSAPDVLPGLKSSEKIVTANLASCLPASCRIVCAARSPATTASFTHTASPAM